MIQLAAIPVYLLLILGFLVVVFYAERKIPAFIQDRLGPMETGKYGLLQAFADILKLVQKEDIVPARASRLVFKLAPCIIFLAVFAGFTAVPLTPGFQGARLHTGIFFVLSIISIDVLGLLMAGWGSNSKFALFGALRAVAQIVSYEIPLGLSVLCAVAVAQSLDLQEISFQQGIWSAQTNYLFGIKATGIETNALGGIFTWNVLRAPFLLAAFVIFFIASLAECNRAPFDVPEAESELVGGFHTEYSGFRFAVFFLAEYGMMLLVSLLAAILFLGSWNTPFFNMGGLKLAEWTSGSPGTWAVHAWGAWWLLSKALLLMLAQVWIRWTFPRLRVDQLMSLCWKILTPAALFVLFLCCVWRLLMI